MAHLLLVPEVSTSANEAELSAWTVVEGASVAQGDVLATLETEKAVVEVEADAPGTVLALLVPAGSTVAVGQPVAALADPGERVEDVAAALEALGVGAAPLPVTVDAAASREQRVFASPLARRLAKDAGLTLMEIPGTGPRNRVLRRDVERAVADLVAAPGPVPSVAPPIVALPIVAATADDDLVAHTRVRRLTAERVTSSKRDIPHFYLRATIRVERLLELRAELSQADLRVSVTDLLLRACGLAHLRVPEMNVSWTDDGVLRHRRVDLSLAVDTERGLLTPVVRDVAGLGLRELVTITGDLVERARNGRLRPDELVGGSLSISNLGMHGTEEFAAIINPGQTGILAVGAIREEPIVRDGDVAVGQVLRTTLSVDHRPVDGVVAARWLAAFVELVEQPVRLLI